MNKRKYKALKETFFRKLSTYTLLYIIFNKVIIGTSVRQEKVPAPLKILDLYSKL